MLVVLVHASHQPCFCQLPAPKRPCPSHCRGLYRLNYIGDGQSCNPDHPVAELGSLISLEGAALIFASFFSRAAERQHVVPQEHAYMLDCSLHTAYWVALLSIATAFVGCDTAPTRQQQADGTRSHVADGSSPQSSTDSTFDTPQAVFSVAHAAAKANDIPRILECHTRETQDGIATHVILGAAMMRVVADKFAERGDDRYAESKKRVDSTLDKYGVDLSNVSENHLQPEDTNLELFGRMAAAIDNRPAFIAELLTELEAAKGTGTAGFQDELIGELADIKIRGSMAEGKVVRSQNGKQITKPILFKNTKEGWRIHMPTE